MDLSQFAFGASALVGLVNVVKSIFDEEYRSFGLSMAAIAGGLLFGYLGWFDIPNTEVGLALALASSGIYQIAKKTGGK